MSCEENISNTTEIGKELQYYDDTSNKKQEFSLASKKYDWFEKTTNVE